MSRTCMSRTSFRHPLTLGLMAAAAMLAACGGGGGDGTAEPAAAPSAGSLGADLVTISGVVAVGPLSGATVCYDLNDNGACDSGEPSATTGADGRFTLQVDPSRSGRHAALAQVPATAVDAGTGLAVGTAFTLKAPASGNASAHGVAITPLSTAVTDLSASAGLSLADAAASVQSQLGLDQSPLANYVAAGDGAALGAARSVNALVVQAMQLASAAGVPADAASALSASVGSSHLALLAELSRAAPASAPAELAAQVLADRNLSAATVGVQAAFALAVAGQQPGGTPGDFVSLRRFSYENAGNYSLFAFVGNSTPDADGRYAAGEWRQTLASGQAQPFNRNTAYWDKATKAWVACDNAWKTVRTRAASGTTPQESLYCAGQLSRTRSADTDVSGRRMADVVAEMRAWPLRDSAGSDTDPTGLPTAWGPAPTALGEAVFPAGSAISRRAQQSDIGTTERFSFTDKPRVMPPGGSGTYRQAATFVDFKRMSGNLVDTAAIVSSANTVFLEDVPSAQADATLLGVKRHRVGFDPSSDAVRFYACDVLAATNVSQNCLAVGEGSSRIGDAGDARVLRFTAGYPQALLLTHKRQRIFVERTGVVFGGYREFERAVFQQRPNTVAWNALRSALALPEAARPADPAATATTETRQLRRLTYTDPGNYNARFFEGDSVAADANGYFPVNERYLIRNAGQAVPFQRNALYWTGTDWYACPDHGTGILVARNVAPYDSLFCGTYADERVSDTTLTLGGRSMADVVRDIRSYGSRDGTFDHAGWGPNPDVHTSLAARTFPEGSTMTYRASLRKATPLALFLGAANVVRVPVTNRAFATWPAAATLEDMLLAYGGDYRGSAALDGTISTLFVGSHSAPVAPGQGYTTLIEMRVAFDPVAQTARFYRNYRSSANNAVTASTRVLETGFRIQPMGTARVLVFDALPDRFEADFGYVRHFAEWGGAVLYAAKDAVPATPMHSVRLNGVAADALLQALNVR